MEIFFNSRFNSRQESDLKKEKKPVEFLIKTDNAIQAGETKQFILENENDFQFSYDFSRCTAILFLNRKNHEYIFSHLTENIPEELIARIDSISREGGEEMFIIAPKISPSEEEIIEDKMVEQRFQELVTRYGKDVVFSYQCTDYPADVLAVRHYPATCILVNNKGVYLVSTVEDEHGLHPDFTGMKKIISF